VEDLKMVAKERLWLTSDRKRVVEEGHKDARVLLVAVGRTVPVAFRGMVDNGHVIKGAKEQSPAEPETNIERLEREAKEAKDLENKEAKKVSNKGGVQVNRKGK
jgi:hypothetical protein